MKGRKNLMLTTELIEYYEAEAKEMGITANQLMIIVLNNYYTKKRFVSDDKTDHAEPILLKD